MNMFIPFVNWGLHQPCHQFSDNQSMSVMDEPFYRKQSRIDGPFTED
jgi:hypothetical protein